MFFKILSRSPGARNPILNGIFRLPAVLSSCRRKMRVRARPAAAGILWAVCSGLMALSFGTEPEKPRGFTVTDAHIDSQGVIRPLVLPDFRLSHDRNSVSVEFAALRFLNPGSNRSRYTREGLGHRWQEVSSHQRLVRYTTLPAKTYRLRVQGATSRGAGSEPPLDLSLEISPAWWNTWWLRGLGAAAFLGLLGALHFQHIEQLKAQEERLRNVVETIPAMTFTALSDGTCTFVNKRWTDYTGLSVEQSGGTGWQHAIYRADLASHSAKWQVSIASGQLFEDEARFRRLADGQYRWFLVRGVPLRDPNGNIVRWYGTLTDIEDRKRAEQALEQSQFYLAEGQRVAHMGSWALSNAGFDHWSSELFKIHGLDPQRKAPTLEEYLGLVHPDDRDFVRQRIQKMLAEYTPFDFTKRIVQPGGEIRYVRSVGIPVGRGQAFQEFVGTGIDVTEQVRLTEELRRSERYLSEGQRLAHMGSWAFNPRGFFDYWSHELFEIYGLDPNQGAPTLEQYLAALHPQDRDSMATIIETMHLERCGCDVKKRVVRPDGKLRYVRCVGIPVIKDDVLQGFLGTAIDITEQELLLRKLERREAYLSESQRLNHTGSLAYDPNTLVSTYWSRECLRIWGFDPDLGPPKTEALLQRIHPEDLDRVRKYAEDAIRSRRDFSQEFRIVLPDGTRKYIHSASHLLFGARGEPVEVLGTHVDITERKRAEQERERLRQLEADLAHINRVSMLGEMGASLAHEIKQPLAAAITSANSCMEWLTHDPPNLDRARAAAARIDKYGHRAAQIIDHIRSLYTKSPSHRELVDVNGIVYEIFTLLRDEAIRYSITMRSELAAELPKISADRVQLQQVFMNLMLNAIESMQPSGGELTVRSQLQDGHLLFSVRDTGLGLPTEDVGQIFSAFFTTKPQGSGMGLAISRSIVESHGGRLWATANDGPGATFHFTLPNLGISPSPSTR
jgi:PAS domain S-box-containing protein